MVIKTGSKTRIAANTFSVNKDKADQLLVLAYDINRKKAYSNTLGQFRDAGKDVLHIDPTPGHTWHVYGAFRAADRSRQSNSLYLGAITL